MASLRIDFSERDMALTGNVFDDIPGPFLTKLPHSLQVMIFQLADNHAATVGVCKSMKIVSEEVQVLRRKELVADIPDWEKSWDAFNYIAKKEWGTDGYVKTCNCKWMEGCDKCELVERSEDGVWWEVDPRHFQCEPQPLESMVSRVFGDRCIVGWTRKKKHPPFGYADGEMIIVFRHRTVLVTSTITDSLYVRIRDHAHDGIQPVLINQRFRESANFSDFFHGRLALYAAMIISVLGKERFAIKVDNPFFLRGDKFRCLNELPDYDEDLFVDVMKATCRRHSVIMRGYDAHRVLVMRAWENGPISFYCNNVLFTSDVIEEMVPGHVLELL